MHMSSTSQGGVAVLKPVKYLNRKVDILDRRGDYIWLQNY